MTDKQRILRAMQDLPADATVEDAIERLYFLARLKRGLTQLDAGDTVSHDDVRRRVLGE